MGVPGKNCVEVPGKKDEVPGKNLEVFVAVQFVYLITYSVRRGCHT